MLTYNVLVLITLIMMPLQNNLYYSYNNIEDSKLKSLSKQIMVLYKNKPRENILPIDSHHFENLLID